MRNFAAEKYARKLKRIVSILFVLVFAVMTAKADWWWNYEPLATDGNDFWVTFMTNAGVKGTDAGLQISLIVVNHGGAAATITVSNPRTGWSLSPRPTVPAGGTTTVQIPTAATAYLETSEVVENAGLHVTSTQTISLYASNSGNNSYDATIVVPTKVLAREYYAQTYERDRDATEFAIVATQNNTMVYIVPSDTTVSSTNANSFSHLPNALMTVTLQAGQAYQVRSYQASGCLSGTHICSTKPIAVFNGNQTGIVPYDEGLSDDHLVEQAVPIRFWGSEFPITQAMLQGYNAYRVTASENNTVVRVNGAQVATLNVGDTYEGSLNATSCFVETSKHAVCFLYLSSAHADGNSGGKGDPSMVLVTPASQFLKNVKFGTFTPSGSAVTHYVNIVCQTTSIGTIRLDNAAIPASAWSTLQGNSQYSFARMQINAGAHTITGYGFSAYVYGIGSARSYAYSAGYNNIPDEYYMHINGKRVKEYSQCINKGAITFEAKGYGVADLANNDVRWYFGDGVTATGKNQTHDYTSTGTYPVNMIISRMACEGISAAGQVYDTVKATVKIFDTYDVPISRKICEGESFTIAGHTYSTNIDDTIRLLSKDSCDSILHVSVRVGHPSHRDITKTVCDSYNWHGQTYTQSGTYQWGVKTEYGCDSTETLYLTVNYSVNVPAENVTICDVDAPYVWRGRQYSTSGTYHDSSKTPQGCDSTFTLKLKVGTTTYDSIVVYRCSSQLPYSWHGQRLSSTGIYRDSHRTAEGCDSTYVIDFRVEYTFEQKDTMTVCPSGFPLSWRGKTVNRAGDYSVSYSTAHGCDSVYRLHVIQAQVFTTTTRQSICQGESYTWEGQAYTTAGTYTKTLTSSTGCDSVLQLVLTVNPVYNKTVNIERCANRPYTFGGEVLTQSGTYTKTLTASTGCDSTVTVNYTVYPLDTTELNESICNNSFYMFGSQRLTTGGTYSRKISSSHGCDSVVILHLTVLDVTYRYDTVRTCQSAGPYHYGEHGNTATQSGDYTETLATKNAQGCDSILKLHLIVEPTIIDRQNVHMCKHELPYNHPDMRATKLQGLMQAGVFRDTLRTSTDCDSIIELHLAVGERTYNTLEVERCDNHLPYVYLRKNISLYRDTVFNDTLVNSQQCDSVLTVRFTVNPTKKLMVDTVVCESTLPFNYPDRSATGLQNLMRTGSYTHTLATTEGCDSVIYLNLTVLPTTYDTVDVTTCESVGAYPYGDHGRTASATGIYIDTLNTLNQYGCDSVLVLRLTVLPTILDVQNVHVCKHELPYNHPDTRATGLQGLTQPGIFRDTLKTVTDCDSIVELRLTIGERTYATLNEGLCDNRLPYTDPNTGLQLFRDTVYNDTLTNSQQCDSILTIRFTVYPTKKQIVDTVVCESTLPFNYPDRSATSLQNLTQTGSYTHTLATTEGCDSVIYLNLTVLPTTYEIRNVTWCESAGPYPYGDHGATAIASGTYRDTLNTLNQYGCDSVLIVHLNVLNTIRTVLYDTVCDNFLPYNFANPDADRLQNLTATGVYTDTVTTSNGCDSILELHLFVPHAYYGLQETIHMCDNEVVTWNGHVFDGAVLGVMDSVMTLGLQTQYGCDSVVTLNLHVHPTYYMVEQRQICQYDTTEWHGRKYWRTGVYFDSLRTATWGCDSVHVLELYVKPVMLVPMYYTICDNETLVHRDTLWYDATHFTEVSTTVWMPGIVRPQRYTDVTFKAMDGCDSIIYRYYLTINPTYLMKDSATFCSNERYTLHGNMAVGKDTVYDTDRYIAPLDTVYTDSLLTQAGCDSVYVLYAHILPQYHHVDYDTICDNQSTTWRGRAYEGLLHGDYVYYDSLRTAEGCDSVYEFRLCVHPTYFVETHADICDDEQYDFNGRILTGVADSIPYFYTDSLATTEGCDSIFHLYLTIHPTVWDTIVDTVCFGDIYYFHEVPITQPGHYQDTLQTPWGCNLYTDLFLEMIPPTRVDVRIDSICADNSVIDVYYSFEGRMPIGYSAVFDSVGMAAHLDYETGLIDKADMTLVNEEKGEGMFSIPLWHGEALPQPSPTYYNTNTHSYSYDTKYEYVRPDDYRLKVYLDNGICLDSTLVMVDTVLHVLYPDWIHEQHWNDAIVLFDSVYNGGYTWSAYQWYEDGQPLIGQVREYYYNPQELSFGHEYRVLLTRADDGRAIFTCPIYPGLIKDEITPKEYYLSVVPTLVVEARPVVNIMHTQDCWWEVTTVDGVRLTNREVLPANDLNATEVTIPAMQGYLVVHMGFTDGSYERSQKVLITP